MAKSSEKNSTVVNSTQNTCTQGKGKSKNTTAAGEANGTSGTKSKNNAGKSENCK